MTLPTSASWTPPPLAAVEALHERYLREIVIARNICPFAQRCVDQGRFERQWWVQPSAKHDVAQIVGRMKSSVQDSPLEILLVCFVLPPQDPHRCPQTFETWHRAFREELAEQDLDRDWYTVTFHPQAGDLEQSRTSAPRFVSLLRRSPDPLIQCVRVSVLEQVRAKAQERARQQLIETLRAQDPSLAMIAESCVMTDSGLSASIATKNHEQWAQDPGWRELSRILDDLAHARRALEP